MTMTVICPRCGREYEADRAKILAGTWRDCPYCKAKKSTTSKKRRPRYEGVD